MNTFAERLKEKLEERQMTQSELARRLEVSTSYVNHLCTGRSVPTTDATYATIASALDCSVEWLKTGQTIIGKMYANRVFRRGEIYMTKETNPDDTKPSRPVVIISNDHINEHASRVEVVFLTSQEKKALPTNVPVMCKVPSIAICSGVATISKTNLTSYVRSCTDEEVNAINAALLDSLGLKDSMGENAVQNDAWIGAAKTENELLKTVIEEQKKQIAELKDLAEWQNETEEQIEKKVYKRLIEELLERVI